MKKIAIVVGCISLIACSSLKHEHFEPICFSTEDEARKLGSRISDNGYFSRVRYWVTGDSSNPLPGIGLMWAGFDPSKFCPDGGYPIVATYESDKSDYDPELVMRWSRTVLKAMIKEQKNETK